MSLPGRRSLIIILDSELQRGDIHFLGKDPEEAAQAFKAGFIGNGCNGKLGMLKQVTGIVQADTGQVAGKALSHHFGKNPGNIVSTET